MAKKKTAKKSARGGARDNAGRPPLHGEATQPIAARLPGSLLERLDKAADLAGKSRSAMLVELLDAELQARRS